MTENQYKPGFVDLNSEHFENPAKSSVYGLVFNNDVVLKGKEGYLFGDEWRSQQNLPLRKKEISIELHRTKMDDPLKHWLTILNNQTFPVTIDIAADCKDAVVFVPNINPKWHKIRLSRAKYLWHHMVRVYFSTIPEHYHDVLIYTESRILHNVFRDSLLPRQSIYITIPKGATTADGKQNLIKSIKALCLVLYNDMTGLSCWTYLAKTNDRLFYKDTWRAIPFSCTVFHFEGLQSEVSLIEKHVRESPEISSIRFFKSSVDKEFGHLPISIEECRTCITIADERWTDHSICRWVRPYNIMLDVCIAFASLPLAPYVLLEIFDADPTFTHHSHLKKIRMLERFRDSMRKIREKRALIEMGSVAGRTRRHALVERSGEIENWQQ